MSENNNLLDDCCCLGEFEIQLCKKTRKDTAKEIFGEIIKSTALCEPQGGHCSLDYLVVRARQYGLEYAGLDKDGNVIWVGDTIKLD